MTVFNEAGKVDNRQTKESIMPNATTSRSTRIAAVLAAATLSLAACGGGESSKDDAVSFFIDFAKAENVELDKSCVEQAVDTLSDADAQTLADLDIKTFAESEPEFNEAIDAVGDRVFDDCIEQG
ncbi:MAG: hypothetical protein ACI9N0_002777 [Ilumatobacter sp.]